MKQYTLISILCIAMLLQGIHLRGDTEESMDSFAHLQSTITFSQPKFTMDSSSSTFQISLENATGYYIKPGCPALPIVHTQLTFPFKTHITSVSLSPKDYENIPISTPFVTCPLPQSNAPTSVILSKLSYIQTILRTPDSIPQQWMDYRIGTGIKNNERVLYLSISLYPVRYQQHTNTLLYLNECDLSITYEESSLKESYSPTFDMLILAPKTFSETLQPLLTYRNTSMNTCFAPLEEIPTKGRDRPEDIKLFIQEAIESWGITHVLLIGDDTICPVRYVHIEEPRSVIMGETNFISDLYYADIYTANGSFSSWDTNQNNRFGEYKLFHRNPTDILDLYPDVYLGRLPCQNPQELSTYINKTIDYESRTEADNEWFSRIIAVGGDTFTEDLLSVCEGEKNTDAILTIMQGFEATRLWGTNGNLRNASDINNALMQGAGFLCFEGHAGSNCFRTHPQAAGNLWIPIEWYRTYHINQLQNKNHLPIVTINACNTCKFNVNHTCFCWSFLTNSNGGGIASAGMTCLSWIYPGIFSTLGLGGKLHIDFYNAYIQGSDSFGSCWTESIIQYLNDHPHQLSVYDYKTIESWQPFGDPALNIYNEN